jgi:hypothetical protein
MRRVRVNPKKRAHDAFDPIWRDEKLVDRRTAYQILQIVLEVPAWQSHMRHAPASVVKRVPAASRRLRRLLRGCNGL